MVRNLLPVVPAAGSGYARALAQEAARGETPAWVWLLIILALLVFAAIVIWWWIRTQKGEAARAAVAGPAEEGMPEAAPAVEAAGVGVELPAVEVPEVAAELPTVEVPEVAAELPTVEVPEVAAELPTVEVPEVAAELPTVEVPEVAAELPTVEVPEVAAELPTVEVPEVAVKLPEAGPDDLKIVEGIGPKIAGILRDAGILTWAQLAATEVDQIKGILERANPNLLRLVDPTTWPEQARMAAAGEWDALKKWQDQLKGGQRR